MILNKTALQHKINELSFAKIKETKAFEQFPMPYMFESEDQYNAAISVYSKLGIPFILGEMEKVCKAIESIYNYATHCKWGDRHELLMCDSLFTQFGLPSLSEYLPLAEKASQQLGGEDVLPR